MPRKSSSSLHKTLSATLLAVMVGFGLLSFVILRAVIAPAFDNLERAAASTDLARAMRAIRADLDKLVTSTGDWAPWDDAHGFVRGTNPQFVSSNLDIPTIVNLDLDVLAFYDAAGNNVWRQLVIDGAPAEFGLLGVLEPGNPQTAALVGHDDIDDSLAGLLRTNLGAMLISSMPIIHSDETGPIAGTLVMARFLDNARIARLSQQAAVPFRALLVEEAAPGPVGVLTAPGAPSTHTEIADGTVASHTLLDDLFGEPLLVLRAETPRDVTVLGAQTVNTTLLLLAAAGVGIAVVAWVLLRGMIVEPLQGLARHIVALRRSGDLSKRVDSDRSDEIGALASEFDRLTNELQRARRQLLEQSFRAGKADTASEVLHNIRNALTPLVNGLERVRKHFAAGERLRVRDATAALRDNECDEDRRQKFLDYIDASFDHLDASSTQAGEELGIALKQARQVEAILADQEKHSRSRPVYETLRLDELAGEAVHVLPKRDDDASVRINLAPELAQHRVRAHRVGLQQILGNLVLNAYESIQRSQSLSGEIGLSAAAETVDDKRMVRLVVRDSGCGFDEKIREKIFQRGFTSKQGPLTGLGLHWCANAVAGMGGRIHAESMGPGRGAEFHVLLPDGG